MMIQPQPEVMMQQVPMQAKLVALQPQNQVVDLVPLANQKPPRPIYAMPAQTGSAPL